MKIRFKLILGFSSIVGIVLLVGFVSVVRIYKIAEPVKERVPASIRALSESTYRDDLSRRLQHNSTILSQAAANYIFTQNRKWRKQFENVLSVMDALIKEAMDKANEKDKTFLEEIEVFHDSLVDMEKKCIYLVDTGKKAAAARIIEDKAYQEKKTQLLDKIEVYVERQQLTFNESLLKYNTILYDTLRQTQILVKNGTQIVFAATVLSLIFAIVCSLYISHHISRPIVQLTQAAAEVGKGNLNARVNVQTKDEINQLGRAFNRMMKNLKENTISIGKLSEEIVERRKAEEEAAAASRTKSDFLANMSHELRTPMNSIIGFADVLDDETFGPLNEKQKKYVSNIASSGNHLLSLINNILDLSKAESGKMELSLTSFPLKQLLLDSLVLIKERAMKHNIELVTEFAPDLGNVTADETNLKQIIYNLLSNAAKFTPDDGKIGIRAQKTEKFYVVSVWDTGIGLEKDQVEKVFDEFYQVEDSYTKKFKGTGLGLSLTRRLLKLHGGNIWVESDGKGKGCTFTFVLPLEKGSVNESEETENTIS